MSRRAGRVWVERPVRSLKIKNLQTPAKRRMKASTSSPQKQIGGTGLILLFVGEVGRSYERPRRAQPNRYPDSGLQPHSCLPAGKSSSDIGCLASGESRRNSYPVTVAQPSPIFTGFPDVGLHLCRMHLHPVVFKEQECGMFGGNKCQAKSPGKPCGRGFPRSCSLFSRPRPSGRWPRDQAPTTPFPLTEVIASLSSQRLDGQLPWRVFMASLVAGY